MLGDPVNYMDNEGLSRGGVSRNSRPPPSSAGGNYGQRGSGTSAISGPRPTMNPNHWAPAIPVTRPPSNRTIPLPAPSAPWSNPTNPGRSALELLNGADKAEKFFNSQEEFNSIMDQIRENERRRALSCWGDQ